MVSVYFMWRYGQTIIVGYFFFLSSKLRLQYIEDSESVVDGSRNRSRDTSAPGHFGPSLQVGRVSSAGSETRPTIDVVKNETILCFMCRQPKKRLQVIFIVTI